MVPLTRIVASRGSRLAQAQVEECLPSLQAALGVETKLEVRTLDTPGDRDRTTPLTDDSIPDDFFTRDLDEALRSGEIDITVHSAKDLPDALPEDLCLAALFPAREIRDALVFRADAGSGSVPATIGTSSPRRAAAAVAAFPETEILPIRGDVPDRIAQLDAGNFDAVIIAACALQRLGMQDRISLYLECDPAPQQGRLAIVTRCNDVALNHALRSIDERRHVGLVALVGCAADPAMIPARVERYLRHADVVLHDRLIPDEVIAQLGERGVPLGKKGGELSIPQSEINRRMLLEAEAGKLVVRLQGGDPGIFGHLGEEIEFLSAWGIPVDVVPALSAAQVAAARAHVPLTHRHQGRSITFVSGHAATGSEPGPFPGPESGNIAVYMGVRNRSQIQQRLLAAGWSPETPVVAAERIGYENETSLQCDLAELSALDVHAPAVFLVGPTSVHESRSTLFTGTYPSHFLTCGPLIHWPLIRLEALPIDERSAWLQSHLSEADGILFPSRFAVQCLVETLLHLGDVRMLTGKKLLTVGPATEQELRRFGLRADLSAASLGGVAELAGQLTNAYRGAYLYPCSDAAPVDERTAMLQPHGLKLAARTFYANRPMPRRPLPRLPFHRVLFTSGSTVRTYFNWYPEERTSPRIWLAVGPSTRKAIEALGLEAELLGE